jgi:hypothetical protein
LSDTHIYIGHAFSSRGAALNWPACCWMNLLDRRVGGWSGTPDYDIGRRLVKRISQQSTVGS